MNNTHLARSELDRARQALYEELGFATPSDDDDLEPRIKSLTRSTTSRGVFIYKDQNGFPIRARTRKMNYALLWKGDIYRMFKTKHEALETMHSDPRDVNALTIIEIEDGE